MLHKNNKRSITKPDTDTLADILSDSPEASCIHMSYGNKFIFATSAAR